MLKYLLDIQTMPTDMLQIQSYIDFTLSQCYSLDNKDFFQSYHRYHEHVPIYDGQGPVKFEEEKKVFKIRK